MSKETVANECPLCMILARVNDPNEIAIAAYVVGMLHTVEASAMTNQYDCPECNVRSDQHTHPWGAGASDLIHETCCASHAQRIIEHIRVANRVFAEDS